MGTIQYILLNQAMVLSGNLSDYITLDTLFGAVVVLAILFLIMCITYFVKIKPNLREELSEGSIENSMNGSTVPTVEENLMNDYELVAVITAAIHASMGDNVPAGGFVVRSIRKANSKKWMNA
jgi:glutaconyl-CoA/methylmalonyl-CoA decarboxylase subunit delta